MVLEPTVDAACHRLRSPDLRDQGLARGARALRSRPSPSLALAVVRLIPCSAFSGGRRLATPAAQPWSGVRIYLLVGTPRRERGVLLRPIERVVRDFLPAFLTDREVAATGELLAVGDR